MISEASHETSHDSTNIHNPVGHDVSNHYFDPPSNMGDIDLYTAIPHDELEHNLKVFR